MKIVIFGANGKTGSLLIEQALDKGYQVIAYVRNAGSIYTEHPNLKIIIGNLDEKQKLKDTIAGVDACISTLGTSSISQRSPQFVKGIENIVNSMEHNGVQRFIYMSSIGAGDSRYLLSPIIRFLIVKVILRAPLADHNANEKQIAASKLNWTVVRPSGLTNGPLTGDLKYGTETVHIKGNPNISRANVASFILQQLTDDTYSKKAVWLHE